jgi:hypothetical protein
MPRRKITQAEALNWRVRAQVAEKKLDEQRFAWGKSWPDGIDLGRADLPASLTASISTARKLKHAVVTTIDGDKVVFLAIDLPALR